MKRTQKEQNCCDSDCLCLFYLGEFVGIYVLLP